MLNVTENWELTSRKSNPAPWRSQKGGLPTVPCWVYQRQKQMRRFCVYLCSLIGVLSLLYTETADLSTSESLATIAPDEGALLTLAGALAEGETAGSLNIAALCARGCCAW